MLDDNYNNNIDPYFITGISDAISFQKDSIRLFSTKRNTNNSLNLEIWGTNLRSQVGTGRFSMQVSNIIKLPSYQKSVIIGLLLSDG